MELTKTKIIIFAVFGLIICLIAALVISHSGNQQEQKDGNILTTEPETEHYDTDNRDKPGNRTGDKTSSSSPLRGGHAQDAQQDANYGHSEPGTQSAERRTNSIPDMGTMDDAELDRIQREIEADNRAYSRRQQQRDDSIRKANVNEGVRSLTGKDLDEDTPEEPTKKKDTQKSKGKKGKEKAAVQEVVKKPASGRFSDVAIHKSAKTNAIKAYVHSQQVVRQGSTLKMRVAEDCLTDDGHLLSKNSFVYGQVKKIDGERVDVEITSVNIDGNILPFKKIVYSSDAQRGIRVTNTAKSEAAKEVGTDAVDATTVNAGVGTSGLIGAGVGLVQGAVQGTKRAISKNIKDVKVTIKTNYELLFMEPEENDSDGDDDY